MINRAGHLSRWQVDLDHAGSYGMVPPVEHQPNFRTVRSNNIRLRGAVSYRRNGLAWFMLHIYVSIVYRAEAPN